MRDPEIPQSASTRFPLWVYGVSLLVLGLLGFAFGQLGQSDQIDDPTDFDNFIHAWVVARRTNWPILTALFHWATRFGNPDVATMATALITFGLYAMHRRGVAGIRKSEAFVWLGVILSGRLLSSWLKLVYQRERPPVLHRLVLESTYSFPSGHSVFAAVFFTMLAALLARFVPGSRPWVRVGVVALCLFFAVLIGVSRVWLGVHYPTDVFGGLILGAGWVLVVWVVRFGWRHWQHHSMGGA